MPILPSAYDSSEGGTLRDETAETVRTVLRDHARLPVPSETLARDDDLFAAGLTSHANVDVMLGLEAAFGIEFPDEMLSRSTFATIGSICEAVEQLQAT